MDESLTENVTRDNENVSNALNDTLTKVYQVLCKLKELLGGPEPTVELPHSFTCLSGTYGKELTRAHKVIEKSVPVLNNITYELMNLSKLKT